MELLIQCVSLLPNLGGFVVFIICFVVDLIFLAEGRNETGCIYSSERALTMLKIGNNL